MNKKNSYIAAAALAITGTVGMASWLAVSADELKPALPTVETPAAQPAPGVSETEAVLPTLPPAQTAPDDAQPDAPARIGGVVPAVRATRTPVTRRPSVAREARAAEPEPTNDARTNRDIANRERTNQRTERVEPVERAEPVESASRMEQQAETPRYIRVTVPTNAVLGVRLTTAISSDTAEVEDRVEATVTRDVIAESHVAIPAGTKVLGSVNDVARGGKLKDRARLSVRFHTLVLADGTREAVRVDAIVREGESPARASATKIGGGVVGGAIIGGILGGRKGAILGGAAGAGAGGAAVAAGERSVASLPAGSPLSVRLSAPVTLTRER